MKKITLAFLSIVFCLSSFAITAPLAEIIIDSTASVPSSEFILEKMEKFSKMTPKEFRNLTGRKLSIKEVVQLKMGQKKLRAMMKADGGEEMSKTAYIILVVLGLGFIPIGIVSDWKGSDWWLNLLLTMLCWIPGVIHGLSVMKKYYSN